MAITAGAVGIMLLYALPGYLLVRCGKIRASSISAFATMLMYAFQPCLVIYSFQQITYSSELMKEIAVFFLLALITQCALMALYYFIFRRKYDDVRYRIATVASCFGNCAFMGVPLLQALLPDYPQAVVFSSVYSIAMNLIGWTAASAIIAKDKKYIRLKNFVLNPAVLAVCVALVLLCAKIDLNDTALGDAVFLMGKMTTPMCMLIMGMRLACVPLKSVVTEKINYLVLFLKQIAMPLLGLLLVYFLPVDSQMKLSFYIICCCPVASVVLNYSEMIGEGQGTAANMVLLGTFSSIVTIPVMMIVSGVIT